MDWAHLKTFTDSCGNPWETRTFTKRNADTNTIGYEIFWEHPETLGGNIGGNMRKDLGVGLHFPASSITELVICCRYSTDPVSHLTSGAGSPTSALRTSFPSSDVPDAPLKKLDISDNTYDTSGQTLPNMLSQILALCDELEELRHIGLIPPSTLKAMTFPEAEDPTSNTNTSIPLVPNLCTLRIRASPYPFSEWSSNFQPALLNNLAKSRTNITAPKLAGLPVTLQTASMLDGWKDALRSFASGRDFGSLLSGAYYKQGWKLNEVVKEMEAYDITGFEQILLLEEYNILDLLDRAAYLERARIPWAAVYYKLPERLRALRAKFWYPFVNETNDGRRWVARDEGTCLAYGNESSMARCV
ncbi:hypothetical protein DFP72DRAFT_1060589 [Ephemerocybe angulata]|uniref:Uncharacterized protein n=1 Tax=Ephemerocybe angulata TaxID=980116 RepID=A0A8H6MCH8_9AGAR|nr:hypothetical protein DFP72DRAFT_1060589 [Tulosesus angulatus]